MMLEALQGVEFWTLNMLHLSKR